MPSQTRDYKETINLPQTSFPMKARLPQTEPLMITQWEQNQVYEKMTSKNNKKPLFVMTDGPPYANGFIHIGHVLNKILKDIIIKFQNMSGKKAVFIPGWDCHGLPIELQVTKKLKGKDKQELSKQKIRDLCRQEAHKWIEAQKAQFVRLGILADWKHPYYTLQSQYEAQEMRVLAQIVENGLIYRGEKPVHWCPVLQTALASTEVEYQDHTNECVFVKFYLTPPSSSLLKKTLNTSIEKPIAFVIWTTTPWTLPANYAICLNKNIVYGCYETKDEVLILAQGCLEETQKKVQEYLKQKKHPSLEWKLIGTIKGKQLQDIKSQHPFMDRVVPTVFGPHVDDKSGSGCVHTAPGHGMDDYLIGLKYSLPLISPVNSQGCYTKQVPQYEGMHVWKANSQIIKQLEKTKHLLAQHTFTHSYPYNPRSQKPVIFRCTPQWFIRLDDKKFPLRKKALKATEQIQFVPEWGRQRMHSMLSQAPDWCLSRQRIWGVPLPVFYCKNCHEPLLKKEIICKIADEMERSQKGIEAYHSLPSEHFTQNHTCAQCGGTQFTKSEDILDVWFDSGVSHTGVQKIRPNMSFPADIYLEGSDQHRGWFLTSLLSSLAAYDQAPYKALVTHGFVNDSQGRKMSKSLGNVIDPEKIINQSGAEILRLWVACEDYGQDINLSPETFKRTTETYRRMRNIMRFLLGNINDFNFQKDKVPFEKMTRIDLWTLMKLNHLTQQCQKDYQKYDFHKVYHYLNYFFTVDLSSIYLDILKDRLYTAKKTGLKRRASQTVFYHLLHHLTLIMAPILSFLSEEIYKYLPGKNKNQSIFENDFPETINIDKSLPDLKKRTKRSKFLENFEFLIKVRQEVSKKLESLRQDKIIGSSLEAQVTIYFQQNWYERLKTFFSEEGFSTALKEFLIVSEVKIMQGDSNMQGDFKIEDINKARGEKCIRCWQYSMQTGSQKQWPQICMKCVEALT